MCTFTDEKCVCLLSNHPSGKEGEAISERNAPEANEQRKPIKRKYSLALDIMQLILKIALIIGCIAVVFTFVYGVARIPDVSMKPAIRDGDLALYYRLDKRFSIGDVAVVQYQGKTVTGRVVAMEGDLVDITGEGLLVNGAIQVSQDIYYNTTQYAQGVSFPLTVGEGQVFLLGDYRPSATDSRIYGCVDLADVKGKVIAVIRTRGI